MSGVAGSVAGSPKWWPSGPLWDWCGVTTATLLVLFGSLGESYPTGPTHALPPGAHPPPWPAYLLVAAAGIALAGRRRWPVAVLLGTVALTSAYSMLGYVYGAALIAPTIALYAVVVERGIRRAVLPALAAIVALTFAGGILGPYRSFGGAAVVAPFELLVAVGLGMAAANRKAYLAEAYHRARQAERSREEEALRRVDAERLRIARELHDVVAHTMATISVQAAAAAHVLTDPPKEAADAIAAIRAASKDGLRELRAILNVLRQADDRDSVHPTPGLDDLDVLVGTVRRAGVPVTVRAPEPMPPRATSVDVAAYRIIQESLTNVLRHAGPAAATVTLAVEQDRLVIDVVDTGVGVVGQPTGHGLNGMRERGASTGGTVRAGPGDRGGFAVHATLPLGGPAS